MKVRRVVMKGVREFDITVCPHKDPATDFPTIMLIQGDSIIAVPFGAAGTLARTMKEAGDEFLREQGIRVVKS